jgi:hypothetical protein
MQCRVQDKLNPHSKAMREAPLAPPQVPGERCYLLNFLSVCS